MDIVITTEVILKSFKLYLLKFRFIISLPLQPTLFNIPDMWQNTH